MKTKEQLRGLKDLALDAVENGSLAMERLHADKAKKTFEALEQIPKLAVPMRGLHEIHDTALSNAYGLVRLVNRVVGETVEAALGAPPPKPPVHVRPSQRVAKRSEPIARTRAAS